MCEPTTILLIASTVIAAGGAVAQGVAANNAGKANARVQEIMAADAIKRGNADEASQRRITKSALGKQRARFAASGAEANTGSAAEIQADTAEFGELDALRIRNNAEREAFALEAGAAISRSSGKNALLSGVLKAGGSLIGGAGKVSSKWDVFKADNPDASFGEFLTA